MGKEDAMIVEHLAYWERADGTVGYAQMLPHESSPCPRDYHAFAQEHTRLQVRKEKGCWQTWGLGHLLDPIRLLRKAMWYCYRVAEAPESSSELDSVEEISADLLAPMLPPMRKHQPLRVESHELALD